MGVFKTYRFLLFFPQTIRGTFHTVTIILQAEAKFNKEILEEYLKTQSDWKMAVAHISVRFITVTLQCVIFPVIIPIGSFTSSTHLPLCVLLPLPASLSLMSQLACLQLCTDAVLRSSTGISPWVLTGTQHAQIDSVTLVNLSLNRFNLNVRNT